MPILCFDIDIMSLIPSKRSYLLTYDEGFESISDVEAAPSFFLFREVRLDVVSSGSGEFYRTFKIITSLKRYFIG